MQWDTLRFAARNQRRWMITAPAVMEADGTMPEVLSLPEAGTLVITSPPVVGKTLMLEPSSSVVAAAAIGARPQPTLALAGELDQRDEVVVWVAVFLMLQDKFTENRGPGSAGV